MEDNAPNPMPRTPKAFVLAAVIFYIPFVCLFLPAEIFPTDRSPSSPLVAYTTPFVLMAYFFYYVPMLVCDTLRPLNDIWFYIGAFVQSLLLTSLLSLVLRALLYSRWRQLTGRSPA